MLGRLFSVFNRHRVITAIIGLTVLTAGWYLFRPELLFINQRVNEAAPFDASTQPLDTGVFSQNLHDTRGRATIYRQSDGVLILRLSDFRTSNGPELHVVLATHGDLLLQDTPHGNSPGFVELGTLKSNEGDQEYALPAHVDVSKYGVVSIFSERSHAVFGTANLEPF